MAIRKISIAGEFEDSRSYSVGIPKDDLRVDGLLEELKDGEEMNILVDREGPGEWRVEVLNRKIVRDGPITAD